jgi:hypothetical protein
MPTAGLDIVAMCILRRKRREGELNLSAHRYSGTLLTRVKQSCKEREHARIQANEAAVG